MSDGFTFVADIFTFTVDTLVISTITSVVNAISPVVKVTMGSMFGLYSVYLASQWIFNRSEFPLMEGLKILGLFSVVMFFAFSTGVYINDIVPIILNSGDDLAGLISGTGSTAESLDEFITVIYKTVWDIWDNAEMEIIGDGGNFWISVFNIALFIIGAVPFIVTSFGILLTAKIMVALLLCVGTIYICFSFFPPTRHWFQQWVNLGLNYSLIAFLFPVAFSFTIKMVETFVYVDGKLQVDMASAFKVLIILGAFLAISIQIPVLASSLSGGVGINGMSGTFSQMAGGIKNVFGAGTSVVKGAFGGGKATYDLAKRVNERRKNGVKGG